MDYKALKTLRLYLVASILSVIVCVTIYFIPSFPFKGNAISANFTLTLMLALLGITCRGRATENYGLGKYLVFLWIIAIASLIWMIFF